MSRYEINDLLQLLVCERAEGLSLHVEKPPVVHLRGELHTVEGPAISAENAEELLRGLADTRQIRELRERGHLGFVHTWRNDVQFRVKAIIKEDGVHLDAHRLIR